MQYEKDFPLSLACNISRIFRIKRQSSRKKIREIFFRNFFFHKKHFRAKKSRNFFSRKKIANFFCAKKFAKFFFAKKNFIKFLVRAKKIAIFLREKKIREKKNCEKKFCEKKFAIFFAQKKNSRIAHNFDYMQINCLVVQYGIN